MPDLPFIVALTGGVASGKSAVADRFAALGVSVVDADIIARELVQVGRPALTEIVAEFGAAALDANGALDRRAMRERIFADPSARARLDAILHPLVRSTLREQAMTARGLYVMLVVPLLAESGRYDWIDRVLLVDAPRELQRQRLIARDGIAPELAEAMLDAQATRAQRLAIADDVIVNVDTLADLHTEIAILHARYLAMAADKASA